MWTSAWVVWLLTWKRTSGSFPAGCNSDPLTALGVTSESARLSMLSWRACTKAGPAAHMSAPESGRTLTVACPLQVATFMWMVGAGMIGPAEFTLDSRMNGSSLCSEVLSALAFGVGVGFLPEGVDRRY